jgi:hypothetical protein
MKVGDYMFEKRNISKEEAVRRACKQNGLEYVPRGKRKPKMTITLVDDLGNETLIDNKMNVVKPEATVKTEEILDYFAAAKAGLCKTGKIKVATKAAQGMVGRKAAKVASSQKVSAKKVGYKKIDSRTSKKSSGRIAKSSARTPKT